MLSEKAWKMINISDAVKNDDDTNTNIDAINESDFII